MAKFWRADDGDDATFEDFVRTNFAGDQATLDTIFNRLEHMLEQLYGHMHEINREFRQQLDLDLGPVLTLSTKFLAVTIPQPTSLTISFRTNSPLSSCLIFP